MTPERVWSDLYGCPRALFAGLAGGHRWLLVSPARHVGAVVTALGGLRFKGEVHLIVTDDLTPVAASLRDVAPRGVIAVGESLAGGPALTLTQRTVDFGDFSYREGGDLPAWEGALRLDAPRGECAPASLCAQEGVPVVSAAPADLARVLSLWWAQTPHSLAHVS